MAISKAPPMKVVKEASGKIDTENPINAIYLAEHSGKSAPALSPKRAPKPDPQDAAFQKAVRKHQEKKLAAPEVEDPTSKKDLEKMIAGLMGEAVDLDRQKKVADIALKVVMEKNHALRLAHGKGEVITREAFRRTAEEWNAKLSQNVMRVPRRVISRLWSMAKAGDDRRSGEDLLEKELSKAVTRALEGVAGAK